MIKSPLIDHSASFRHAVNQRMPCAKRIFDELRERTRDAEGVTRPSYGTGEQIAHDLIRKEAELIGLEIAMDAAGNLYATLPGSDRDAPRWISGSHLDSVQRGGNYDGAAGVIAALISLAALKDLRFRPSCDLTMMAIRAEESSSWFTGHHGGHLGSRCALGLLAPSELESAIHIATGRTLSQSIDDAGFCSTKLRDLPAALNRKNVRGFIELHIEQGPALVHDNLPTGIVTSIRGNLRARKARCLGAYSHSGAVPQQLRHDAVLATAEFIHTVDRETSRMRSDGADIVFTCGRFHTDAKMDSLSKVPGETTFTLDVRSQSSAILQRLNVRIDELATEIASHRNVRFELGERSLAEPTPMDDGHQIILSETALALGISSCSLPSGAGHDAADFARAGIPSNMIFVRNTGESHNPSEHMEMSDFQSGVSLLSLFLAAAVEEK